MTNVSHPSDNQAPWKVLLVEDNPGDARLAQEYMREDPHFQVTCDAATSLAEGLEKVRENAYDVVLLDLTLPDSTGFATFEKFYAEASQLPIIVLSGQEDELLAREIVHHGGQDSMPKDLMSGPLMRRSIRHAIERKHIHEELRSIQMQLIQAEKMDSVGRLAAGVAHEVKNPLARIAMGLEYLSSGIDPNDPNVPIVLQRMEDAVGRAETIISGLLNYSSNRVLGMEEIHPENLVKGALLLVDHELKAHSVDVEICTQGDLPPIRVDKAKMEQALINLLTNAVQAMTEVDRTSRLTLNLEVTELDDRFRNVGARSADQLRPGDRVVMIEIHDVGPGIGQEADGKLFDPFFTTKPTGVGTGLGLTVVRKIIALHEGLITIGNREASPGATARLFLRAVS